MAAGTASYLWQSPNLHHARVDRSSDRFNTLWKHTTMRFTIIALFLINLVSAATMGASLPTLTRSGHHAPSLLTPTDHFHPIRYSSWQDPSVHVRRQRRQGFPPLCAGDCPPDTVPCQVDRCVEGECCMIGYKVCCSKSKCH